MTIRARGNDLQHETMKHASEIFDRFQKQLFVKYFPDHFSQMKLIKRFLIKVLYSRLQ